MIKTKSLTVVKKNDLEYIQFPKLSACGAVRHIFSTRNGGVSTGDCATMNLSFNRDDNRENVLENYRILCSAVGIDVSHLVLSHQTHTNNVKIVGIEHCGTGITKPSFTDIDGLITNTSGVALVTQYADCTPLLFCDPVKKVIATSHSGWRGTVKGMGIKTVEAMTREYGTNPKDIVAVVGPSLCKECYEVSKDVVDEFHKAYNSKFDVRKIYDITSEEKRQLDLWEANKQILMLAGIKEENIVISNVCTSCNEELLYSHRKTGGKRGNLVAVMELI